MEFGNGSSVLQIRAQKYAGKVVGKTPRNDSPAALFLKEEFVLQPDSDSVYVRISHCALKLYFPIEWTFLTKQKLCPLMHLCSMANPSLPLPDTTNLAYVSDDLTSTQLPGSVLSLSHSPSLMPNDRAHCLDTSLVPFGFKSKSRYF